MRANNIATIDPIAEFASVEKMLYALAWKFAKAYSMDFEETKSQAYAGYMKACNNFRRKKGMKFSSWCYFVTWGYLKSHIMKRAADPLCFVELNDEITGACPEEKSARAMELLDTLPANADLSSTLTHLLLECPAEVTEAMDSFSSEAEEMFRLFLECPGEIVSSRRRVTQVEEILEHHASKHGESKSRAAFREICQGLREAIR